MKKQPVPPPEAFLGSAAAVRLFQVVFGLCLVFAILKFPNPPIMEKYASRPGDIWEVIFTSAWPVNWLFTVLGMALLTGWMAQPRWNCGGPGWICLLPLVWFVWQVLATFSSIDSEASIATLKHFAGCAVCFYLGCCVLARQHPGIFWWVLSLSLLPIMAMAWEQHFGGLETSRNYFMTYVYPTLPEVAPEYLKKLNSTRVFGPMFYPNALAGIVLLLVPILWVKIWIGEFATKAGKGLLISLLALGAAGCLYWSGSKGGWLLALGAGGLALLGWPMRLPAGKWTWIIIAALLLAGGAGFLWRYQAFFQRGATSVVARFDYWEAAAGTSLKNPILGTGPGTFAKSYAKVKRPESEMSRLAHNDYLQQASDSGFPGALAYTGLVAGVLWAGGRSLRTRPDLLRFAVWLGTLTWALQGVMEFGLYLPGIGWTAFCFLGWLTGCNTIDTETASG